MPYLEFDGAKYYYAGTYNPEKPTIIFCHGSGGAHHHWLFQLKGLKGKYTVIAVDLPGHGRSEGLPSNEISFYRDWLHRFSEALGSGPFIAAGHSMGGAIALSYALHYPVKTRGVILIGSGGRLRVLPAILDTLKSGTVPSNFADFLYSPDSPPEMLEKGREEVASTDSSIYYADLCACNQFDIMEQLGHIAQPALIICGEADQLTPEKYSHFLDNKLPDSTLEIIGGAGHMVMVEKPEEVNRAIDNYMQQFRTID